MSLNLMKSGGDGDCSVLKENELNNVTGGLTWGLKVGTGFMLEKSFRSSH